MGSVCWRYLGFVGEKKGEGGVITAAGELWKRVPVILSGSCEL